MMSQYPKLLTKMNTYLHCFLTYFENVINPAEGKSEWKNKRRNSKASYASPSSPDSLNIRAAYRSQNSVRRNPAP
jgi:hypothetical protein